MTRITTNGNRASHIVHGGYKYASDPNARLEPTSDNPPRLFEYILCAFMALVTLYAVSVVMGWLPNPINYFTGG